MMTATASETWRSTLDKKARISKEDIFLLAALWMEKSPVSCSENDDNKCGGVFVDTRKIVVAMECTRSKLHPAELCVALHGNGLIDAEVYMSRPPCSVCVKCLVQAKVKRIFHLPRIPENETDLDHKYVDAHVRARSIGMSDIIPGVPGDIAEECQKNLSEDTKAKIGEQWGKTFTEGDYMYVDPRLPYSSCKEKLKSDHSQGMKRAFDWVLNVAFGEVPDSCVKDQDVSEITDIEIALHSIRLAHLLLYRADDANLGSGAVLLKDPQNRDDISYIGIGWSGYPRDSKPSDYLRVTDEQDKRPFVITAPYNAVMFRIENNAKETEMYVSGEPTREDMNLLRKIGVNKIYYIDENKKLQVEKVKDPGCEERRQTTN